MEASASTIFPPTSPAFEFSFERSKGNKSQLKSLIVQEATEIHREYLANKGGTAPNDSTTEVPPTRDTLPKKRSLSTGRPTHASSSNGRATAGATASNGRMVDRHDRQETRETAGAAHDDDDNISKHSYKSEVTSSTQGTHNRRTTARTTTTSRMTAGTTVSGNRDRESGIGYPQQKDRDKDRDRDRERAKSTGRVQMSSKPLPHQVEIEETERAVPPRQVPNSESQQKISHQSHRPAQEDIVESDDEDERRLETRSPQRNHYQSYHEVQSPSRRNRGAMHELEDELSSKKAMSYLSKNQTTATSARTSAVSASVGTTGTNRETRAYIPRRGAESDDDDDDNSHGVSGPPRPNSRVSEEDQRVRTNDWHVQQRVQERSQLPASDSDDDSQSVDEVDRKLVQQYASHQIRSNDPFSAAQIRGRIEGSSPLSRARALIDRDHNLEEDDDDDESRDHAPEPSSSHHTKSVASHSSSASRLHPYPSAKINTGNPINQTGGGGMGGVGTGTATATGIIGSSAGAGGGGGLPGGGVTRKKGLTVPKSPQFSKMSWQRSTQRQEGGQQQQQSQRQHQQEQQEFKKKRSETGILGPKPTSGGGDVGQKIERKRSTSGLRSRPQGGGGDHDHGHQSYATDHHSDSHSSHQEASHKARKSSVSGAGAGTTGGVGGTRGGSGNQRGSGPSVGRIGRYYC
jgi:hypothetical protein